MMNSVIGAMDGAASSVVSYSPPSGTADQAGNDFSQSVCMQNMIDEQNKAAAASGTQVGPVVGPWLGIDCLIDSVIGIHVVPKAGALAAGNGEVWFNKVLETGSNGTNQGPHEHYYISSSAVCKARSRAWCYRLSVDFSSRD